MTRELSALRLGTKVRFQDRWQGLVTALDVSDDWEVLNISIGSGFAMFRNSARIPFSAVTEWSEEMVAVDAVSFHAFGKQLPPVAAPSRPVSAQTPVAHPGVGFAGLLVRRDDRRVEEALLAKKGKVYRIPVLEIAFEGKSLALRKLFGSLPLYVADDDIEARVLEAIAEDRSLTPDDKRSITVRAVNGIVTAGGNVRVDVAQKHVIAIVSGVPGVLQVHDELVDDIELETAIGLTLDRAGLLRHAGVYARSNLGRVELYGHSPSLGATDDICREVSRVHGVREVKSLLELRPAQAHAATVGPAAAPAG
jgi:osmotically-inducible protein OsmY